MTRHLLTLLDLEPGEIHALFRRAQDLKHGWGAGSLAPTLPRRTLGLLFEKPSTRTRVSFEAAMHRLGGECTFMNARDTQLGRGEPLKDTARILSRYVDALVVRTFGHDIIEELARYASIPVINGLTDRYHPCQVLADLLTVLERRGSLDGLRAAWIGDGNNMCHSWMNAAARLHFRLTAACPEGYMPDPEVVAKARAEGADIHVVSDPREAVADADVVNTDVWASMGQESEAEARKKIFAPYQVNATLLKAAPPSVIVLHCLPAHRGEEITEDVIEGPRSAVWDQAENRLHVQGALLEMLILGA